MYSTLNLNPMYKVGAYERLSREDDNNLESASIQSQKMIIESFARFNNLNIIKHYSDDGYTGSNFNRPGFQSLVQDIEDKKINCVLVKDLSRLGRQLYETGNYIEEYFLSKGVRFIAINDGYDSDVGDSMLGIRLSVNDMYLRDTSKKIKASLYEKRNRGQYLSTYPKYGYLKDPEDPHHLIIDPDTAPIVKQMFIWACEGKTMTSIASELTKQSIPIPCVYKKENRPCVNSTLNNGNGVWRANTVKDILTSEMYLGHMVQGKTKKASYKSKKIIKIDKSDWSIVKNTHEPIISQELFDKVQIALTKVKKFKKINDTDFLLKKLLYCKECGSHLYIYKKPRKHDYAIMTRCTFYARYGKYSNCSGHCLNYEYLEEDVLTIVRTIGSNFLKNYDVTMLAEESARIKLSSLNIFNKRKKELENEISKTKNIISNLYIDKVNGIISNKQFSMLSQQHETHLENLESNLETLSLEYHRKVDSYEEEVKSFKILIENFMSLENPTSELLFQIIDKIEVDKNKHITITFKIDVNPYINKEEYS